jgi:hypothetical protein
MLNNDVTGEFTARPAGAVGAEILNPEGYVIAWSSGKWAAIIVELLNGAQRSDPCLSAARHGDAALMSREIHLSKGRYP